MRTLRNVPIKHLQCDDDSVVVTQYDSTRTEAGIELPDSAKIIVMVANKVGKNVKHVQEGDIVIIRNSSVITECPEVKGKGGPVAIVPASAIPAVIRGYDWRSALMEEIVKSPKLVV